MPWMAQQQALDRRLDVPVVVEGRFQVRRLDTQLAAGLSDEADAVLTQGVHAFEAQGEILAELRFGQGVQGQIGKGLVHSGSLSLVVVFSGEDQAALLEQFADQAHGIVVLQPGREIGLVQDLRRA